MKHQQENIAISIDNMSNPNCLVAFKMQLNTKPITDLKLSLI